MNISMNIKEEKMSTTIYNTDWYTSNTLHVLDAHVWDCII